MTPPPEAANAGMLWHIDGSKHRWLNDGRWRDLIVVLDAATSELYCMQRAEKESTRTVREKLTGLRDLRDGRPRGHQRLAPEDLPSKPGAPVLCCAFYPA